jgi:chorismate mutase / prephenate dehydratase
MLCAFAEKIKRQVIMLNHELQEIRNNIDNIDKSICDLINQRAMLAIQVSKIKASEDAAPQYYRPEREAEILRRIMQDYQGVLNQEDMARIFQEIMQVCLALQQQQKVAFLGPIGTFSHACALRHFGQNIDIMPYATLDEVFASVESDKSHYGIIPFENSTSGVVTPTLDLLIKSQLFICGEHILPVHQNLLRSPDDVEPITRIYSHPHSFEQCKEWLNLHLPQAERIAVKSNAQAAKLAKSEKGVAAIAGTLAAQIYHLDVVSENIEGSLQNATRFIIIGKQKVRPSGKDKTSMMFATPHTPGALINLMLPFHKHHINLTSITSRPYENRQWSYLFFIDIEGHQEDENVKQALAELATQPLLVHVLGSYPVAVLS